MWRGKMNIRWPDPGKDSLLEEIFNERFKQMEDEAELDRILEPLPDKLFEID
jgi:hypothetical protein